MNKKYIEHNCEPKNESSCEEEIEDNGIDFADVEGEEFGE